MLWPVAELAAKDGFELVLTVFSESASGAVARLAKALRKIAPDSVALAGYSPWEGGWGAALEQVAPSAFVTAKYEAWPELWASLGMLGIPLSIVSARKRKSLEAARLVCGLIAAKLPRIELLTITDSEEAELRSWVCASSADGEGVSVAAVGDPRWDRVLNRSAVENPRVKELVGRATELNASRPWFVLGSVWPEDVETFASAIPAFQGTLWIVPHSTSAESLEELERALARLGKSVVRSTGAPSAGEPPKPGAILVDEHGVLSELYGAGEFAYVGGGFRKAGLHSVAEPAVHGVPVLAGPSKSETMSEVAELTGTGQLEICSGTEEAGKWLARQLAVSADDRAALQEAWRKQAEARAGASRRVLDRILSLLKPDR